MIDNMLGRLAAPFDVRRSRRAAPPADVRGLPRDRHVGEGRRTERSSTSPARQLSRRGRRRGRSAGAPARRAGRPGARQSLRAGQPAVLRAARLATCWRRSAAARRRSGARRAPAGWFAAWRELQEACRSAYPAVVRQEYDSLFVGVGKAPVTPYLSAYAEPHAPDRYLLALREQLGRVGPRAPRQRVRGRGPHLRVSAT